jgi:hypothetical protein
MSENENKTPSKQTSSVPLKKETVRVTLKAADSPPAVPSASLPKSPVPPVKPPTPPVAPPVPVAPKPPTATAPPSGAPTAPRAPVPAPTIPLRTASPPTAGAPTIRLATSNAPVGAPTIALKTANAPLPGGIGGGAPTVSLPKATVALSPPTKPLTPTSAAATQKPTLSTMEETEDESGADTFSKILAGVGLAAAIILLGVQLKLAGIWIGAEDNEFKGQWSQLLD